MMRTNYITALFSIACLLATHSQAKPLAAATTRQETPAPAPAPTAGLYSWQATDFSFGCGSAACGLGFNVSATAGYVVAAPAFDVQCGALYGAEWTECTPNNADEANEQTQPTVQSTVLVFWDTAGQHGTAPPYRVRVAHAWFDEATGARWNTTASGSAPGGEDAAQFRLLGQRLVAEVETSEYKF
ncbi:hypothetical protein DL766_004807 [Monosporascus sp. MC13-8B]|uniref:Uncharacterized protein n=1 Tax=Monosporascus cannonballus TaxID=155416 RepID=A0ABY0H345_9PEZI|nr:hypothetical protein DL762_007330 [Monosporascus cannonballus]RYO93490.1 hypothetical protein DL763_004393 [Monosporascus cannonballus]RYP30625.1 hypothetical protein DL766_004807 [Monosporascus sp. MC13-8B]